MTFDQCFADYVHALNKFYAGQTQEDYENLAAKRRVMQERDANLLKFIKDSVNFTNSEALRIASERILNEYSEK